MISQCEYDKGWPLAKHVTISDWKKNKKVKNEDFGTRILIPFFKSVEQIIHD